MTPRGNNATLHRGERMIVLADGDALIEQLENARLSFELQRLVERYRDGRQVVRTEFYASESALDRALQRFGSQFLKGCRQTVLPEDRAGAAAWIAAEIVFHAASGYYDHLVLLCPSVELLSGLRRAADLGRRSSVWSLCHEAPPPLRHAADDYLHLSQNALLHLEFVEELAD